MKRILLFAAALTLLLAGCNKNTYTINGTLPSECEGYKVYMTSMLDNGQDVLDSTIVVNGAFSFTGQCPTLRMVNISSVNPENGQGSYFSSLVLEPGVINIFIDQTDSLSGTPLNDLYHNFRTMSAMPEASALIQDLYTRWMTSTDKAEKDSLELTIDRISDSCNTLIANRALELYRDNQNNEFGCAMLLEAFDAREFTAAEIDDLLKSASDLVRTTPAIESYVERVRRLEQTSAGHPFIDLEGIDFPTGAATRLSTLIQGKLAVVDFWASWCGPCKQEIRDNLINLYHQYRNKGVVVVGVDVWDKVDKHAEAVQALGIDYPQLIDTTRNASTQYGFNAIPQIILISADGTILARDLRGPAIEEAIIDALNQ